MDIKPILSALSRHRVASVLIAMEIALACAVLCNAIFLVSARLDLMRLNSGIPEGALATVAFSGCDGCSAADVNGRAVAALAAIPGVSAVGVANTVPFGQRAGYAGINLDREGNHFGGVLHFYKFDAGAIAALGLVPSQGDRFAPDDFRTIGQEDFLPADGQVWITQALADHLWPGQAALGREFWMSDSHFRVKGVLPHLAVTDPGRSEEGLAGAEWSVVVPVTRDALLGRYVVRADPHDLPRVALAARDALARAVPEAVVDQAESAPVSSLREKYFQTDRAMAGLLVAVIAAMLLVTALGIVGLASFWVAQRTRQIGVRRALGATRAQILRYFQVENFLLVGMGIALGMLLAYALNQLLMSRYELPRLPLAYLPAGAMVLWLLGQVAVLWPARRAAAVPPAIATRSA